MKISTAHQRFADRLISQRALDHPEEFLGPNWKDVLNFWIFIDTLTEEQMKIIYDAFYSLSSDECQLARRASCVAARAVAASDAACYAANYVAASYAAASYAAGYATWEIMGSHILQEQGKSLVFFPLFLNL